jgi:MFS family permease
MVPLVQRLADLRGSAFGLLAAVQSLGNVVASAVAGVLWTAISAWAGLSFAAALMGASLVVLALGARPRAGALDVVKTLLTNRAIRALSCPG